MQQFLSALLAAILSVSLMIPPAGAALSRPAQRCAEMTLREKITQMLMVDFRYWNDAPFTVMNDEVRQIVSDYRFGSIIYFAQNLTDTEQAFALTAQLQQAATQGGGVPMLIAADQEGGSVFRLNSGTALPGNMALGAAGDPAYARLAGTVIGSELRTIGINTNLAPVADVNSDAGNPVIGLRSFGDDPVQAGQLACAVIDGMAEYDVIGCAKHFPGHGNTSTDSHYGLPIVDKSLEELLACDLIPFQTAINGGVEMIMTAHILYPQLEHNTIFSKKTGKQEALPATMSDDILTGLLKETMGFEGIVVTDAMNMAGVSENWTAVQAAVIAIQAGADMLCMPCSLRGRADLPMLDSIIAGIEAAVADGTIPLARIDDAVTRILTIKENHGLLDNITGSSTPEEALSVVGGEENRRREREIAAAAVTVVRNEEQTLPLTVTSESRVLMMVPYDNEQAQMLLGWNRAKEAGLIPDGAQVRVITFTQESSLTTLRGDLDWADTVIINSEISSAAKLNGGSWLSARPLSVIDYARAQGKITIVQSVDKPYDVQSYPNAHAVLAVYGCKGSSLDPTQALVGGVTTSQAACGPNIIAGIEVILGVFPARGTLPVDIPRYTNGSYTDEILFPRGYGLHYDSLLPQPEPEAPVDPEPELIPPTESVSPESSPAEPAPPEASPAEPESHFPVLPILFSVLALTAAAVLILRRSRPRGRRKKH